MRRHTLALVGLATVLPCLASAAETPRDHGLVDTATFEPDLLGGVTVLETEALAYESGHGSGPGLYRELPAVAPRTFRLRLIPYYAWNNRGTPRMTVWIPVS